MIMYLFDTDTIIYWLNGNQEIEEKVEAVGLDRIAYSIISQAELYFGAYKSNYVKENIDNIEILSEKLAILPFEDKAAGRFGQIKSDLKKQGLIILDADIMIASIALAYNLTLVTNNVKHFNRIPDLRLETWTQKTE
ncbi:MAG TPA: type II toxin-antitoxin system VapC family toxin [Thiotrichaceae bacterium]|nr:type II toxin-antitoxin system VapC family toxin [Thiotrichaceae bacterium]